MSFPFALLLGFSEELSRVMLWVSLPRFAPYFSCDLTRSHEEAELTSNVHSVLA